MEAAAKKVDFTAQKTREAALKDLEVPEFRELGQKKTDINFSSYFTKAECVRVREEDDMVGAHYKPQFRLTLAPEFKYMGDEYEFLHNAIEPFLKSMGVNEKYYHSEEMTEHPDQLVFTLLNPHQIFLPEDSTFSMNAAEKQWEQKLKNWDWQGEHAESLKQLKDPTLDARLERKMDEVKREVTRMEASGEMYQAMQPGIDDFVEKMNQAFDKARAKKGPELV